MSWNPIVINFAVLVCLMMKHFGWWNFCLSLLLPLQEIIFIYSARTSSMPTTCTCRSLSISSFNSSALASFTTVRPMLHNSNYVMPITLTQPALSSSLTPRFGNVSSRSLSQASSILVAMVTNYVICTYIR